MKANEVSQEHIQSMVKTTARMHKLVNLFAEDNLTVNMSVSAQTACYFPETKVLELPYNLIFNESEHIAILFITHEVGHAYWSSADSLKEAIRLNIKEEDNIIDDIRIERKIKEKYPGVVRDFIIGYSMLYKKGFFGSPSKLALSSFANRLNVYAKCGPITAKEIYLNEKEMDFYNRCMKADTEDEVLELAKELANWTNRSSFQIIEDVFGSGSSSSIILDIEKLKEQFPSIFEEDDQGIICREQNQDDEAFKRLEEMSLEERMKFFEDQKKAAAKIIEAQDSVEEFNKNIKSGTIKNCTFHNYESEPVSDFSDVQAVLKCIRKSAYYGDFTTETNEYLSSISNSVNSMVQEFEMRKSAEMRKHRKVSESGTIDMNRVALHKVTDKIFGKRVTLPKYKNHGFVILLDASGSISSEFESMVKQTLILTEFCRKTNIPFKVITFGGRMAGIGGFVYHLEFLSSDTSNQDYIDGCSALLFPLYYGFHLVETPTQRAMYNMETIAVDFFKRHRVTKKKLVIITDGAPTDLRFNASGKNVFLDAVTNQPVVFNVRKSYSYISAQGMIFKNRYDIDLVTFSLASRLNQAFIHFDVTSSVNSEDSDQWRKEKYVVKYDSFGFPIIGIRPKEVEVDINDVKISSDSSVAEAASALTKKMSATKSSKNLMRAIGRFLA